MSESLHVHQAFKDGDLEALRSAAGDPLGFPDCEVPYIGGHCLEYAIYHSPYSFIVDLVELGADPNYEDHNGFPSIIAALSTDREDKHEVVAFLISRGADVHQRGLNDYTPLHYAAARNDPQAVDLLLSCGADISLRTRIDDLTTPLEEAELLKCREAAERLRRPVD